MDKKGFTLVELLTVIVLLGLIAVITTPVIIGVLQQSKKDLNDRQIAIIEEAAEKWGVQNMRKLPKADGGKCCLIIADLQSFLSNSSVKNTVTGEYMQGYVEVKANKVSEGNIQYSYKYNEDNDNKPDPCVKQE